MRELGGGRNRVDKATHKEAGANGGKTCTHTAASESNSSSLDFLAGPTYFKVRTAEVLVFLGKRPCYLGAAAGFGAEGLVPARAVHVVVAVPLELEQHHVGQAVGGVPAVLESDRF